MCLLSPSFFPPLIPSQRIAKATGATVVLSLAEADGGSEFSPTYLGRAESVSQERVADDELIFVRGTKESNSCSIVFRGPNTTMLDEMERAMHDALSAVARTLESGHVVAGGGECEGEREKKGTDKRRQGRWRQR